MRKILSIILVFFALSTADASSSTEKYVLMQSLLNKQSTLAVAINAFIEARGEIPASITALKNANYLPVAYDAQNPFDKDTLSFSISNYQIRIDSNVETASLALDKTLYYINSFSHRDLDRQSVQEGGKLISYYALSAKSATNLNLSSYLSYATFKGDIEPNLYTTVTTGSLWFSSTYENMYQLYSFNNGSWGTLEKGNKNFDSINGILESQRMLPLLKSSWETTPVTSSKLEKAIECANLGLTYNPFLDRCEAYTSNACDASKGEIYRTATGKCDLGNNSACAWVGGVVVGNGCKYTAKANTEISGCRIGLRCIQYSPDPCWSIQIADFGETKRAVYRDRGYATCNIDGSITFVTDFGSGTIKVNDNSCRIWGKCSVQNGGFAKQTTYSCPYGGTLVGTECVGAQQKCPIGYVNDGYGHCAIAPTCSGKTTTSPYGTFTTPHYGNNGVCYSDMGLYCKTAPVSEQVAYGCFNTGITCNDSTYNLRTDTDICEKFSFTCNATKKRYGLSESPTISDSTELYNRITNKDEKLNSVASTIITNDYNTNDNNGAMCVELKYTEFIQPYFSPDYSIGGEIKSGF